MPDLVISEVSEDMVEELKAQAARHRLTLEQEARRILERGVVRSGRSGAQVARALREELRASGRVFADGVALIREDRER